MCHWRSPVRALSFDVLLLATSVGCWLRGGCCCFVEAGMVWNAYLGSYIAAREAKVTLFWHSLLLLIGRLCGFLPTDLHITKVFISFSFIVWKQLIVILKTYIHRPTNQSKNRSNFPLLLAIVYVSKGWDLTCSGLNENIEFVFQCVIGKGHEWKVPQDKCFLFPLKKAERGTIYHTWRQTQSNEENKSGQSHATRVMHYTCLREVYNTSNDTSLWIM